MPGLGTGPSFGTEINSLPAEVLVRVSLISIIAHAAKD
jgi:hypothetical protein